jgi:hypothetical protein
VITYEHAQRVAFKLALALLVVAGSLVATVWAGVYSAPGAPAIARASANPIFYGADTTKMVNAIQHIWPQNSGAYCGIETAEAAVNYDDEVHGVAMVFTSTSNQVTVSNTNQASGASQWGYATPTNAYAGETNIAPDFGTDPRSIAYMEWNYSPNNTFFHDYIYRWTFSNSTQPSYSTQVQQATTNVARALETWHEPVNVTINGGLHSVLVSGIYAYNDPATNYPANISSVVYRDPEGSSSTSRVQVDFTTWKNGSFASPFGVYSLWSLYYGDQSTVGDGLNTSDPEPSVGPYVPNGSNPYHWYHGFTWVQRDTNSANGSWNPDWSFTSTGQQMSTP